MSAKGKQPKTSRQYLISSLDFIIKKIYYSNYLWQIATNWSGC